MLVSMATLLRRQAKLPDERPPCFLLALNERGRLGRRHRAYESTQILKSLPQCRLIKNRIKITVDLIEDGFGGTTGRDQREPAHGLKARQRFGKGRQVGKVRKPRCRSHGKR